MRCGGRILGRRWIVTKGVMIGRGSPRHYSTVLRSGITGFSNISQRCAGNWAPACCGETIQMDGAGLLDRTRVTRKTRRPYSAECVEGLFSEVREYAQSPSVCSAVFPIQWEGGLSSEGSRVLSSPFASSNCSWVRSSAPERFAPERSASPRAEPRPGNVQGRSPPVPAPDQARSCHRFG